MELKRYVLTNGNEIIEDNVKGCYVNKHGYAVYGPLGDLFDLHDESKKVKRTSDNILDLVEVGDMVEIGNRFQPCGVMDITDIDGSRKPIEDWWLCGKFYRNIIKNDNQRITAIYKRQPNGDYKRYEVK
jgi:hypothetical protein